MSQNRHFWQGMEVSWRGEIIDVMAGHGGGIYFTDQKCGTMVQLDPDVVPKLYPSADDMSGHLAVAQFRVSGALSYRNGAVVLRPTSLNRTSAWATDREFDAYMDKWLANVLNGELQPNPPR